LKEVGLGLVGLGYIGKTHLRHCLKLESARLVAVSDVSKRALNFARKMGVKKTFRDYQQLLKDDQIDAVIVALPTYLHVPCANEAADAGKDIFLEKPLARNAVEGREITSKARKCGAKLMVGYPFRFLPSFRNLKQEISTGALGEVQTAYASLIGSGPFLYRAETHVPHPVPSWWLEKESAGGGSLLDQGCHLINLLRWFLGEVADAKCKLGYRFNLDVEDHAMCMMKFRSGQTAVANVGWYSMKDQIKVELLGSVRHAVAHYRSSNKIISALKLLAGITPRFDIPYLRELQHFVHCVKEDISPSPSGDDALRDLELISSAYKNQISLGNSTIT